MTVYVEDVDFTLYVGDALETLRGLPDESVHCCVTSPPSDSDAVQLLAAQVDRLTLADVRAGRSWKRARLQQLSLFAG